MKLVDIGLKKDTCVGRMNGLGFESPQPPANYTFQVWSFEG
uniref:Uncharacterized protein n=1 Tax=Rhizophora mucronata TaxID=61149 RepID=A0A2P2PDF0_RHIMU